MKLTELQAFAIFEKYHLPHSAYYYLNDPIQIQSSTSEIQKALSLPNESSQVVVKVDAPIGGKMKSGLMAICELRHLRQHVEEIYAAAKKLNIFHEGYLVEPYIEHEKEYFLSLKAVREGIEVSYSPTGGIDIETNWQSVKKYLIPFQNTISLDWPLEDMAQKLIDGQILSYIEELLNLFQLEDVVYLEINPFTVTKEFKVLPLGIVMVLDEAAAFRHPQWPDDTYNTQLSPRESEVAKVDSQIKGSIKLVEVKQVSDLGFSASNLCGMMGGGAGAALYLCDAIIKNGLTLANYAEFSGNPPDFAVAALTKAVSAIPGIKYLVIGSGIANFTSVVGNFEGIIEGLKNSPQAKNLQIVIRRCGPGEDEGIALMKDFAKDSGLNIQVFGRETPMTEIVKKLLY